MWVLFLPILLIFAIAIALLSIIMAITLKHRKRKFFGGLVALVFLLASFFLNNYGEIFALHPLVEPIKECKQKPSLRIMAYNIWNRQKDDSFHELKMAEALTHSIDNLDVDVLILCELSMNDNSVIMEHFLKHYPHSSYEASLRRRNMSTQVFSLYPISDFKGLKFFKEDGTRSRSDSWLMTIATPQKDLNVVACHLASNSALRERSTSRIYKALKNGYERRAVEANALRDSLDIIDAPVLVLGDFNDLSGSYVMEHIKGDDLADVWWEGGCGFGFTYDMHHLLLRLDHILYSKKDFELRGVWVLSDWKYSDHYPIVADFEIKQ